MKKEDILKEIKSLNKIPLETKIAVIMGGKSAEKEVSLRSGANCLKALLELGYKNSFSLNMDNNLPKNLQEADTEIAFIALHGTYGEDGCIQGLLESLDIAYTGCGVMASAICMNKSMTKKVLQHHNIPCPKTIENTDEAIDFPVFCKPTDQGSSLGAGIANNLEQLKERVAEIKKYSSSPPLIETFIRGKELTVGVLQTETEIFTTDILGIEVKKGDYDYTNKYTPGAINFTCPANIDEKTTEKIKDLVKQSFKATNCRGCARIDVILQENNPYIIEINTIPGMTDTSDLPHQSKTFGISYNELVNIILHSALL